MECLKHIIKFEWLITKEVQKLIFVNFLPFLMTNILKLTINTPSVKKAKLSYQESVSDNSCQKNPKFIVKNTLVGLIAQILRKSGVF